MTTADDNKALVQRAFGLAPILCSPGAIHAGDHYAPDFVFHGPSTELTALAAFTDIQVELQDLIAEDNRVVARWAATGAHTSPFLGVAPSGQRVGVSGITIMRCAQNHIAEGWGNIFWD